MDPVYQHPSTAALIQLALDEDLDGRGDVTVQALVDDDSLLRGELRSKQAGVCCGLPLFALVCEALSAGAVQVEELVAEGAGIEAGELLLRCHGPANIILMAERTALNLIQRLGGVASQARRYADAVAGSGAAVFDTRKTTPALRLLEKHAVRVGGCRNHRSGLYDQVLIKENHIALMGASGPAEAVRRCREELGPSMLIEVEIERVDDLPAVIAAGADIVLLDNLPPEELRRAVALRGEADVQLEASGGITLANVAAVAASGVERISVGALTHSVPALDCSLRCSVAS